ncbi:MAG: hypothetical protein IPP90_22420 [Gemmatimonadaceae bacterium]|nr:hypothetical protein [Gemmatimonadaceae bacterium]
MKRLVHGLSLVSMIALHVPTMAAQISPASSVADLPLIWVAPQGVSAHVTAVLLSGDGGWAELIKEVADGLAAHGIGVVGFNSRAWLSKPRTPEATAAAVVRAIDAAQRRWPADRLLLVGYSRGADMAPFVATRLPQPLAAQLAGIAMFGLAPMASFEFHLIDLVKDTRRASDIAIEPELEKLRGTRMVCVYGTDEETSGCRDDSSGLMTKDARPGGHHFDRNSSALVAHVLALLVR